MGKKLTIQDLRDRNLILYETYRGSTVYGTNVPGSDLDIFGIYICPIEDVIGLGYEYQSQVTDDKGDAVFYELKTALHLISKSNPSLLEIFFIDDEFVIYEHPLITDLKKYRQNFITKACFPAFYGYAVQQIKKAKGLNKKCNMDPVTKRLGPLDFCYVYNRQGSSLIKNWMHYRNLFNEFFGVVSIPNSKDAFGLYYDWKNAFIQKNITLDEIVKAYHEQEYDCPEIVKEMKDARSNENTELASEKESLLEKAYFKNMVSFICDFYRLDSEEDLKNWYNSLEFQGYRGIVGVDGKSEELRYSSVEKDSKPIAYMSFSPENFTAHCKAFKDYTDWVKNRNQTRYLDNIQSKRNYDTKNMMHSVRLLTLGIEVATTGQLRVNRRNIDREFLLDIRHGKYDYEWLINYIESKKELMDKAMAESTLSEQVNMEFLNDFLIKARLYFMNQKEMSTVVQQLL